MLPQRSLRHGQGGKERKSFELDGQLARLRCIRLRGQSFVLFRDGQVAFKLGWSDVPQR